MTLIVGQTDQLISPNIKKVEHFGQVLVKYDGQKHFNISSQCL